MEPSNQDIITAEPVKGITVRMPESYWDRMKVACHQQRITMNAAFVRGSAQYLGIDPPTDESEPPRAA